MSRYPARPAGAGPWLAEGKVVPLRPARMHDAVAPPHAAPAAQRRETSWRDLVRRLAKNPAQR